MNQKQSRRALIGVGVLGALLLSTPLLWQAWTNSHELTGKVAVFDAASRRPAKDMLACLVHRPAGGLRLEIMTANHFADPDRGITVRIEQHPDAPRLKAWITRGQALSSGEAAQLQGCAG